MNEMYEMSQSIHIFSVIAMVMSAILLLVLHKLSAVQEVFVKRVALANLLHVNLLGAVALTGVIMMAAKHLSFSFANIVMIIGLVAFIVLEVKRTKLFKMVTKFKRVELEVYQPIGFNFVLIELVLLLVVGAIAGMAG